MTHSWGSSLTGHLQLISKVEKTSLLHLGLKGVKVSTSVIVELTSQVL